MGQASSWSGFSAYAESKLCDVLLAFAIARRWKDVKSNALEPGWVPTKMGGPSAPDDLHQGCVTRRGSPRAKTSWRDRPAGISIINGRVRRIASDVNIQEELLAECGRISGIPLTN